MIARNLNSGGGLRLFWLGNDERRLWLWILIALHLNGGGGGLRLLCLGNDERGLGSWVLVALLLDRRFRLRKEYLSLGTINLEINASRKC